MSTINRKHLALLNKIVQIENEVERLNNLCVKLKNDINNAVKQNELTYRFKSDFHNLKEFIKFIQDNIIEDIKHCEDEGIYIEYRKQESDEALNKRKQQLQERLDKITSHYLPFNRKKLHDAMLELTNFENNED